MNLLLRSLKEKKNVFPFVALLLLVSLKAEATTTVTVDNNTTAPQTVVVQETPVVVTTPEIAGDFQGRISQVHYTENWIVVQDSNSRDRQVSVAPDMINNYRIGDYVLIHPTSAVTLITLEENPKDFEGEIIRVDIPRGQIVVLDTIGRERRVQMKEGMIGTYSVGDYVRVHLMADLKEAKTIETVRGIERIEGNIVSVNPQASRMIIRDSRGRERTVLVRQGLITDYRVGNQVRVYQLMDHEDVQLVRMIRVS